MITFLRHSELKDHYIDDRKKYIGGSDIAAIMGADKYGNTKMQVIAHKADKYSPPSRENQPQIRRGIEAEPIARSMVNELLGTDFKPVFVGHKNKPYAGGNLDGYCEKTFQMLEIKTSGEKQHNDFKDLKIVPYHHELQIQYYMALILSHYLDSKELREEAYKTLRCVYVDYRPEDNSLAMTYVEPNIDLHMKIMDEVDNVFRLANAFKTGV